MDGIIQFLGRLHPLLIHLPIGFVCFGILLLWIDRKKNHHTRVIELAMLWGGICAMAACVTGYLHYLEEGYAFSTISSHLWTGILTTFCCFLLYWRVGKSGSSVPLRKSIPFGLSLVLFVLLMLTGHFGGTITHGEDYLTEPLPQGLRTILGYDSFEKQPIVVSKENWEEVDVYKELISPILQNNCASCHNPSKLKGGLVLTTTEGIQKGGESGSVIAPHDPQNSELFSRLILPKSHEDHMPPSGKSQPAKVEINMIKAWVEKGSPFEGTMVSLGIEKSFLIPFFAKDSLSGYPQVDLSPIPEDSLKPLKKKNIHINSLKKTSGLVEVSMINHPEFSDRDLQFLLPIAAHVAVLDLGGTQITDSVFSSLSLFENLTVLKLDHTAVRGNGLDKLQNLEYLRTINLTSTRFEKQNLGALKRIKNLKSVYLFKALPEEINGLQELENTGISVEYGNYTLPALASDSISY